MDNFHTFHRKQGLIFILIVSTVHTKCQSPFALLYVNIRKCFKSKKKNVCYFPSSGVKGLTLSMLDKMFSADHILIFFFLFSPENKISYFMQTGDNLHEISNPVFREKNKISPLSAKFSQIVIKVNKSQPKVSNCQTMLDDLDCGRP